MSYKDEPGDELRDSSNLQPPYMGQGPPLYPELAQVNRVTSGALKNTNVYPAFVQQFSPALSLRDREASYVWEPNGIALSPGYYDTRLVGVFPLPGHPLFGINAQLPLYATTCCPAGTSSSSSSSSSSSGSSLIRIPTGTGINSGNGKPFRVQRQITVTANSMLIVPLCAIITGNPAQVITGVTFAGIPLQRAGPLVSFSAGGFLNEVAIYSRLIEVETEGFIIETIDPGTGSGLGMFTSSYVQNLTNNAFDQSASNTGTTNTPDTGATPPTLTTREFCQGAFILLSPTGSWTWRNKFASGNQDVSSSLLGSAFTLTEGYRLDAVAPVDASISGTLAQADWGGILATYD